MPIKPQLQHETPPRWARILSLYATIFIRAYSAYGWIVWPEKKEIGKRRADFLLCWNVFCFLQPFAIKKESSPQITSPCLKTSWRLPGETCPAKMYTGIKLAACDRSLLDLFFFHRMKSATKAIANNLYRLFNEWRGESWGIGLPFLPTPYDS